MIDRARTLLIEKLKSEQSNSGAWEGYLSSSAVSTAVATFALACSKSPQEPKVIKGVEWLQENQNSDGGWGDTPQSPSNMTATLLVSSTLYYLKKDNGNAHAWLMQHLNCEEIEGNSKMVIKAILSYYGDDLTFSAPILSMCTLSGLIGDSAWKMIPKLPFSLAILPRGLFKILRISVVSYAVPALIAVGILQYKKSGRYSIFKERIVIPKVLKLLESMLPESGGFLEAAPLTGFVAMCLHSAGYGQLNVVQCGLKFLDNNMRSNGSWPIDTNLSTWVTSLATTSLATVNALDEEESAKLSKIILERQSLEIHPFTVAKAGGWGWTNLSGSVPDADDTSGALIALYMVGCQYNRAIEQGLIWLLELMNSDGGVPTFCRGWGFLPFDRSCPDISGHALKAFYCWRAFAPQKIQRRLEVAIDKILCYLERTQDSDGAWTPLWFGAQDSEDQQNRVYGTAVVLEHILVKDELKEHKMVAKGCEWLLSQRNVDGMWGGELGAESCIETTSRAISALKKHPKYCKKALESASILANIVVNYNGDLKSTPIGLYFASLWYDERLYPVVWALSCLGIDEEQN